MNMYQEFILTCRPDFVYMLSSPTGIAIKASRAKPAYKRKIRK